jgi:hypothetical protein
VTKEQLSRYINLRREIERQEARLDRLQDKVVPGVVRGSMSAFPYIQKRFHVAGVPVVAIDKLEKSIAKNIKASADALLEIEQFIGEVEDPKLRELLRSRFIDGLKWEDVGKNNFVSTVHAKRIVLDYLKKIS